MRVSEAVPLPRPGSLLQSLDAMGYMLEATVSLSEEGSLSLLVSVLPYFLEGWMDVWVDGEVLLDAW